MAELVDKYDSLAWMEKAQRLEARLAAVEAERASNAEGLRYWNQRCVDAERKADEQARNAAKLLRARLAKVEAERDGEHQLRVTFQAEAERAEARLVPVVELINGWWDKPGSLTYDEAFTAVEAALCVSAAVERAARGEGAQPAETPCPCSLHEWCGDCDDTCPCYPSGEGDRG